MVLVLPSRKYSSCSNRLLHLKNTSFSFLLTHCRLGAGASLQKTVGLDQDVIGFDPRGIGATMPRADCFSYPSPDSASSGEPELDYLRGNFHRTIWNLEGREVGTVNSSDSALPKLDSRARTIAKLCAQKDASDGKDSILKYVHTPSVARDMISIIDAWDEWVESLPGMAKPRKCGQKIEDELVKREEDDIAHVSDTKGKLVYWGFSYGVRWHLHYMPY